jgi:hypothetical protein
MHVCTATSTLARIVVDNSAQDQSLDNIDQAAWSI